MMKRISLITLAAAVLAGCNLNQQQLPQSIPATVEQTATLEATVAPTATVIPTATIAPEVILQAGNSYFQNGYFENAATTYKTLMQQPDAPPTDSAEAAYGMGQAAVREGLFEDAVDALTHLIDTYPDDARVAQAHYLRGDAYLGLSQWQAAVADFEAYLALRPGLIDSYVYERIADAQLALNQTEVALASYGKAADASRRQDALLALRERIAQVNAVAGRTTEAVAQYDQILSVAQGQDYRARIAFNAAETLLDGGDTQAGLVRMNQVFTGYPQQSEAYHAMTVLLENGVELEEFARGKVSFNHGDYQGALEAFNNFTEAHTNVGDIPAELYVMLGRAYREIGSAQAALTAFQTIIDSYKTDALFGTALLEQGETSFRSGDTAGAIEYYMHIIDLYGYLPEAPEALWRAGYIYSIENQLEQARAVFERLADSYPDSAQALDGLFLAGALAYNAAQLDAAERYYSEISVKTTGQDQATAYYWVGRIALERGQERIATQAFAQVVSAAPDSYFAARARDVIDGSAAFAAPARTQFAFDEAALVAEAETWLRDTFAIEQRGSLSTPSPELAVDARLIRGRELWDVAEYDEAIAEFTDLIATYQTNPLYSYQLAVYFRQLGAYYNSIVAASYVVRNANIGTLDAPAYIAQLRYPAYYLDLVREVSERREIDPLLLLALIRHESLFNTYANGAADEKGLMQVIPGTAEYIAGQLRWSNYQHADLYRPYAGIEFGAFYLAEQLRRFSGNVPVALSGYNAGPGRAQAWLDLAGADPDQFMTAIDIESTRAYVQNIYGYFNIYRALYGGE